MPYNTHKKSLEKFDDKFCDEILALKKYVLDIPKDYVISPEDVKSFLTSHSIELLEAVQGMAETLAKKCPKKDCCLNNFDFPLQVHIDKIKNE